MKKGKALFWAGFLVYMLLFFNSGFIFAEGEQDKIRTRGSGPICVRNQMPLYLFFLQMAPDKAEVIETKRSGINADYTVSNITVSCFTPATSLYDIQIDMEVSRVTLDFRYGVYDNLEVGLEAPYISLSSGYLDNFVENFEDGIGARTPRSRERQGSYEFDYTFRYNNKNLISLKHSTEGLGDIVLNAKYQLLKEEGWFLPNFSLRTALKLPTGKKDDLLGSGEVDYGAGLLLDKSFLNKIYIYAGANVIFIEKPSFFSELGIDKEYFTGIVAMEYFFTDRFSVVSQVSGNTTPYPFSDTTVLDNNGYEFGLGFNYTLKEKDNISWYFAIIENIKAASSPDVSFDTGLKCVF